MTVLTCFRCHQEVVGLSSLCFCLTPLYRDILDDVFVVRCFFNTHVRICACNGLESHPECVPPLPKSWDRLQEPQTGLTGLRKWWICSERFQKSETIRSHVSMSHGSSADLEDVCLVVTVISSLWSFEGFLVEMSIICGSEQTENSAGI